MSQLNVDKIVSLAGGGGTARIDLESSGNFSFDSGTLYIDAGNNRIGINDSSPSYGLDINATDAVKVPVGTTAQRPTAATGQIRFNNTTTEFEGYNGSAWGGLASGVPVGTILAHAANTPPTGFLECNGSNIKSK